jgi:hypothetical protein
MVSTDKYQFGTETVRALRAKRFQKTIVVFQRMIRTPSALSRLFHIETHSCERSRLEAADGILCVCNRRPRPALASPNSRAMTE